MNERQQLLFEIDWCDRNLGLWTGLHEFDIGVHHVSDQLVELDGRLPPEHLLGLGSVTLWQNISIILGNSGDWLDGWPIFCYQSGIKDRKTGCFHSLLVTQYRVSIHRRFNWSKTALHWNIRLGFIFVWVSVSRQQCYLFVFCVSNVAIKETRSSTDIMGSRHF